MAALNLARRLGFFLTETSASGLTPEGWALLEAALTWSLAGSTPPRSRVERGAACIVLLNCVFFGSRTQPCAGWARQRRQQATRCRSETSRFFRREP
jgi:hypothetical protein